MISDIEQRISEVYLRKHRSIF